MFVVTVKFIVEDSGIESFLPLMRDNADASLSEEPGCRRFDVCQNPDVLGEIFLYEIYDDEAAFEKHKTMPHYIDFTEATNRLVTSKTVQTYRLIE